MAGKQKRLTPKQRNQEKRKVISSLQQVDDATSADELSPQLQQLGLDMAPLSAVVDELPDSERMEKLLDTLIDSAELADEPELAEIFLPAAQCLQVVNSVGLEWDLRPEALATRPEKEREQKQLELLDVTIRHLLNEELRHEVIVALERLRARLRLTGRLAETARAAALQSFLSDLGTHEMWPSLGLIREIVIRSVITGLGRLVAEFELDELDKPDPNQSFQALPGKFSQADLEQKVTDAFQEAPQFIKHLDRKGDTLWKEGLLALYYGKLYLELFTLEEVEDAVLLLYTKDGVVPVDTEEIQSVNKLPSNRRRQFLYQIDDYLSELVTPDRLEQLRARLLTLCQGEADCPPQHAYFVRRVAEYMAEPAAAKLEKRFFIYALLSEMRVKFNFSDEAENQ